MSEKRVILLEDSMSSQADTESVVPAAVSLPPIYAPEKKLLEREARRVQWEVQRNRLKMCETEAGTEADLEDKNVDVVGGIDDDGVSGYESEGFTLSDPSSKETCQKIVSEGVVDTYHFPPSELSNLQQLPITFLLEFLCWPVTEF